MSCQSVQDMHEQIIQLFYSYIDKHQRTRNAENEVGTLQHTISSLENEIEEMKNGIVRGTCMTKVTYQMTVPAQIKEEYAIYIQQYGVPLDGVFNSEKLGEIIQSCNVS